MARMRRAGRCGGPSPTSKIAFESVSTKAGEQTWREVEVRLPAQRFQPRDASVAPRRFVPPTTFPGKLGMASFSQHLLDTEHLCNNENPSPMNAMIEAFEPRLQDVPVIRSSFQYLRRSDLGLMSKSVQTRLPASSSISLSKQPSQRCCTTTLISHNAATLLPHLASMPL